MKTYTLAQLIAKNTVKYPFSHTSLQKLLNIDSDLVDVIFKVAEHIDLRIVQGYRSPEEQNALFMAHKSSKDGYIKKSKHQTGRAIDILPLPRGINMYNPQDRDNATRWSYFVGFFQATALSMNIKIRTGWKWRTTPMNVLKRPIASNTLPDANHLEIIRTP